MASVPRISLGLDPLRRDNPWPKFTYGEIEPFHLPLDDGGRAGRELITDIIKARRIDLMLEIGCFLCGSTQQWLRASQKLTVIGADPWDRNWAGYVRQLSVDPLQARMVFHLSEEQIAKVIQDLRRFGNFAVAMNNVRLYKDRFIPVRQKSPEVLQYLCDREIIPQLIYMNADRKREDLDVAHKLFPAAILCGDGWLASDETGESRVRKQVKAFAAQHGYEVRDARQTWLLLAPENATTDSGDAGTA